MSDPFYKLRKIEHTKAKEKTVLNITMYRLMLNLIFKDLPETL